MGAYWFRNNSSTCEEWTVCEEKFVRDRVGSGSYWQMNTNGFYVSTGHIMVDLNVSLETSDSPISEAEEYIKRGCTLLLIQHLVTSIRHFRELYDTFLERLDGLPIDFMVIPVIKAMAVKPEMVRYFSRRGCPFLCVVVNSQDELAEVKWEWLVQAQSHKRIPFTLIVKDQKNKSNNYLEMWSSLRKQYGIIGLTDIQDDEMVTAQNLRDSGIFPSKGGFQPGGQADYNLYLIDEGTTFDEQRNFRYHNSVPKVTVMNGKIKQVNQKVVNYDPGSHLKVKIHKHFV
ncbi:hypothetical protein [Halobacillus mangrovi]|uniref:Amidohydrolase-related domain-containing protein n=1 Tax=Halobacillus mangrovi TaxID=402384 RepID=A0A1W5ZVD9_9BACI|nr:hypothetical protein [Halobacillus mangrovi]ARI77258.1 hypothetical protein HM131_10580 [Halobacillus mangrovi]